MMMMDRTERPLDSVIIPTHERPECAIALIRAVLAGASPHIEVVVSGTSEVDAISPTFAEEPSSRLSPLRPSRPMSVVENYSFGLVAARGEFLVFIGDDNVVSPDIVSVASVLVRRVRPPAQKRHGETVAGAADTKQALLALTHQRASSPMNLILPMCAR